jgi:hypothetical protein
MIRIMKTDPLFLTWTPSQRLLLVVDTLEDMVEQVDAVDVNLSVEDDAPLLAEYLFSALAGIHGHVMKLALRKQARRVMVVAHHLIAGAPGDPSHAASFTELRAVAFEMWRDTLHTAMGVTPCSRDLDRWATAITEIAEKLVVPTGLVLREQPTPEDAEAFDKALDDVRDGGRPAFVQK